MIGGPAQPANAGVVYRRPNWPTAARLTAWSAVLAAIAVAGAMLLTSPAKITTADAAAQGAAPRELAMTGPDLSGRLKDGRAYGVVADKAEMAPGPSRVVRLEGVRAAMQLDDGQRIDMEAPAARFDGDARRLALSGGVIARRSDGYLLKTEALVLWEAPGGLAAESVTDTTLKGPVGVATGAGLKAAPGLDPIRLTGPVAIKAAP